MMSPSTGEQRLCLAMLDRTRAHLAYLDRDFNIVRVNSTYARTCGKTPDEMIGRNHFELYPSEEVEEIFRRVRDTGEPYEMKARPFEFPDRPERGVTFWDWTLTPVKNEEGKVEGLVFSLHDVTEEVRALQRSEETEQARAREARLLDAIEEATPSLLAYLDRELRLVHVNTAFAAHFGMCGEEMIGRSLGEIAPGSEGVVGLLVGVRETGETVVRSEALRVISRRPELGRRYFDNAFVPVKDEHGHVEGIVISTIDVTEKVEQREKLLQAERARTHFAETVAAEINHRMKNNLMMVAGLLHLQAMQQGLDEPARRLIDTAAARISSIAAVHEELYERRQEAANVVDLLRRMARTTAEAVGAADVEMTVDGDELYCGPKAATSLSIVASELVLNGLKHGGPDEDGRHRIKILARRSADTLRLSVWNSGNPVCYDAGCGAKPRMGMKLIDEVVCGQFGGGYSLRPEGFGTLAEVVLSEGKLREAEEMA